MPTSQLTIGLAMYETDAEIHLLQALLDKSSANAGAHFRSIFHANHQLSAREVCNYLQGVR